MVNLKTNTMNQCYYSVRCENSFCYVSSLLKLHSSSNEVKTQLGLQKEFLNSWNYQKNAFLT